MILSPSPLSQAVNPNLTSISFSVVAKLDSPTNRDLQYLRLGLEALKDGTDVYAGIMLTSITEGRGIHTYLTPDTAIVSLTVPANTKSNAAQLMLSLLKEPTFSDDAISKALARLQETRGDAWRNEVDPHPFVLKDATKQNLMDAFHRTFRPEQISAGEYSPKPLEKDAQIWADGFTSWSAAPGYPPIDDLEIKPPTGNASRVSTGELIGAPLDATAPDFTAQILALYALGVGKCCSLFKISREQHAWSYRQEGFLFGQAKGFEPRLFIAMAPDTENPKRLATLKDELIKDVDTWNAATLQEALGMADANLTRHLPYGPFLMADQPLSDDPEQRLEFALYWKMKTGQDWAPDIMRASLESVDLASLQAAAKKILTSSKIHYLPADY